MPIPASKLAPNRQRLLTFVSPNVADILFVETVDAQRVGSSIPEYGTPHPDSARWPHHELVLVKTADEQGLFYQYFYAAKREAQDDYNFEFDQGTQLVRTYVIPRDEYFARNAVEAAAADPAVPNEFLVPVVTTPDIRFPKFGFADDTLARTETELDSTYVVVRRRYLEPISFETIWDDELDSDVLIERRIIAKDATGLPASGPGVTVERKDVNVFHDLLTIARIGVITWVDGSPSVAAHPNPRQLPSVPSDASYPFPLLLRSASIEAAWAFADSAGAARAYDEAWYFSYDIVEPAPGPYETRIRRFIATNPNELVTDYPVETPPATQRETIGIARWWAYASDKGNSAFAEAREEVIPPSIHDEVKIDLNGLKALSAGLSRTSLPATEGFAQFAAKRSMIIGYEPRKTRYGLYEIRVIELNCTGVYSGRKVPLGAVDGDGGSTGASAPPSTLRPEAPTATINPTNTIVSGKTYPDAQVTVVDPAGAIVGRAISDASGNYSAELTTTYVTAVVLSASVRYNSATSFPTTISTGLLVPGAPTASILAGGTTLSGITSPGATVNVTASTRQVMNLDVIGTVTTTGDLTVDLSSALVPLTSPLVPVVSGDSAAVVAGKIAAVLNADPTISLHYFSSVAGDSVRIRAIIPAADDATLTSTLYADLGITGSFGATLIAGIAPFNVTTVANATTGVYTYTFSPALAAGSQVVVSATGAGGTGPTTTVTVSAAAPSISSATFASSISITGSATPASIVKAYLNGTFIGSGTAGGGGAFTIGVSSLIRGETVLLVAELAGDPTVRSPFFSVTAPNLNLQKPVLTYTSAGWVGTAPVGVTAIAYRLSSGGPETTVTPFPNRNFTFNLPTFGGEQYSVVYRYAGGDSDPVFINAQSIPRAPMRLVSIALGNGNSGTYFNSSVNGRYSVMNGLVGVAKSGYTNWLTDRAAIGDDGVFVFVPFEAGVSVTFTFPGQALNTITHVPTAANYDADFRYRLGAAPLTGMASDNLPTLMNVVATYTDGRTVSISFDRALMRYKYVPSSFGV